MKAQDIAVDIEQALQQHRPFLLRLARSQLEASLAEDAVQETLLAAWHGSAAFQGASSLRTWLVAILRFKIIDQIRARRRACGLPPAAAPADDEADESVFDALFDAQGRWAEQPGEWYPDASESAAQRQLMRLLQACLDKLPGNTSRVFLMREYLGLDTDEICSHTGFSAGNVRVLLYRARMGLRTCLDLQVSAEASDAR